MVGAEEAAAMWWRILSGVGRRREKIRECLENVRVKRGGGTFSKRGF